MIPIKDKRAFDLMQEAGSRLARLFEDLALVVQSAVTTGQIDSFIQDYLERHDLVSQSKGYRGYNHVSCISLNDEVVHGVPSSQRSLCDNDLITIDVCAAFGGYCADMARTFVKGSPSKIQENLLVSAQRALDLGISAARVGNRIGDISFAIQESIHRDGFGIVRDFAGHGIGICMHENPDILNYGKQGTGPLIKVGMAFAIEPMITQGSEKVYVDKTDGWTVRTEDRSLAVHIEDTVLITKNGPKIITRLPEVCC